MTLILSRCLVGLNPYLYENDLFWKPDPAFKVHVL